MFSYSDPMQYLAENVFMLVGALYLVMILGAFYLINFLYGFNFIARSFIFSGLFHALIGICGFLLYFSGMNNSLVCFNCSTSPYLSEFPRVLGLSASINAYAFSLLVALVLLPTQMTKNNRQILLIVGLIILIAIFLSLSKLMIFAGLSVVLWLVFLQVKTSVITPIVKVLTLTFGIFYLLITHLSIEVNNNKQCKYGDVVYELNTNGANYKVCPTFFVQQKHDYWHYAQDFSPWGAGALNIENSNGAKPHNTFLERYALHGITGILSLLLLVLLILSLLSLNRQNIFHDKINFSIALFWVLLLLISINSDVLRYRELWVFLGVSISYLFNISKRLV